MILSAFPTTSRRRTSSTEYWRDVPKRRARPILSFSEFEAVPPGFMSLSEFVAKNFADSGRESLAEIRKRRAEEKYSVLGVTTPAILRGRQGFSQKQLAEKIGTSQPAIARLELGQDRPSFEKLNKLKEALNVSFDELMAALNNVTFER